MSPIQNVVIIGAGGNLGPSVLKAFLDDQSYKVTVLSRASSTATFPDNVKVIKTDYSHASLLDAFKNQDAIISVVPGDKFAQQKDIIDAAVESGVKRFFPSEFGNDPESDEMRARVPLFFLKKQTADYLREVSAKNPDFTYTLLSTGPFFDWGLRIGFLGPNLEKRTFDRYDGGNTQYTATNLSTIGLALTKILSPAHFQETANKVVYISSLRLTQNELLAAVEKVSGESFTVEILDSRKIHAEALKRFQGGDQWAILDILKAASFGEYDEDLGNLERVGVLEWNKKLGLPQEDLESAVRQVLGQ